MGTTEAHFGRETMTYNANEIRAKILRKKILQLIAENYVLSASLISHTLLLSYATVLRHLRILQTEGYIELHKEGRTLYAKIKQNSEQIQILNSELGLFKKPQSLVDLKKNEVRKKVSKG